MFVKKYINSYLKLLITVIAIAIAVISMSTFINAKANVNLPTEAFSARLTSIYSGDIDLFSNYACTNEVLLPVGSRMSTSTMFHVKSPANGNSAAGWQCYIYANAVYNKLFGEFVGNASSLKNSKIVIPGGSNTASFEMFYNAGVRCGAYMRTTIYSSGAYNGNKGHSLVILYYDIDTITYIEGNADGRGLVQIVNETWSQFNKSELSGRSRYISHVVQPKDDYYTMIYGNGNTAACNHDNVKIQEKQQPTCTENGHEEFSVCEDCGMLLGEYKTIPKVPHSGGVATCYKKAICSECSQSYGQYLPHAFAENEDKKFLVCEANCVSGQIYALSCKVCGYKSMETFVVGEADANNHKGENVEVNLLEATCTKKGYTGDTICSACNAIVRKGNEIPQKTHNFNENSEGLMICDYCGTEKPKELHTTESPSASTPTQQVIDSQEKMTIKKSQKMNQKVHNNNIFGVVCFFAFFSMILVNKKRTTIFFSYEE